MRYGHAYCPLDEALSRVVIDFSGRPGLDMKVEFTRANIGRFDVQLFWEFFQGFVNHAGVTLHIDNLKALTLTTRRKPSSRPSAGRCVTHWKSTAVLPTGFLLQGLPVIIQSKVQ